MDFGKHDHIIKAIFIIFVLKGELKNDLKSGIFEIVLSERENGYES